MAGKFYAIKKGANSKTGESVSNVIVTSWNECLTYVKGVKGAIYKSFPNEKEAKEYLSSGTALKKGEDKYPEDIPHIYVDGSYNIATAAFGYGVVVILKNEVIYADFGGGKNKECNQRQVNGELTAAVEGIKYAISKEYDHVVLFYDYAGVCNHATGTWERNNQLSSDYYEMMQSFMKEDGIEITFVKVDSHTDDLFNDMADELAKLGAGVTFTSAVDKALGKKTIKVIDGQLKAIFNQIVKKNIGNIICDEDYAAVDVVKNQQEQVNESIERIKNLSGKEKLKYIKSLKKDALIEIILEIT